MICSNKGLGLSRCARHNVPAQLSMVSLSVLCIWKHGNMSPGCPGGKKKVRGSFVVCPINAELLSCLGKLSPRFLSTQASPPQYLRLSIHFPNKCCVHSDLLFLFPLWPPAPCKEQVAFRYQSYARHDGRIIDPSLKELEHPMDSVLCPL